ncbi:MAG TPA: hypothetical protein VFN87_04775 [Solirubrobacteraceae bacterium]|nr:hypothetical protein [Solirubrobacteraceae bacterium]
MGEFEALRARLGDGAPDALSQLSDAELRHFAATLDDARHRQARAIAEAGDRALHHIPRLLRGPIRRIVG